jgi:ketopantoate reductase
MSSTALDLLAGNRMEVEYLFSRPLKRAQELGVQVPHMESVVRTIEGLATIRGLR